MNQTIISRISTNLPGSLIWLKPYVRREHWRPFGLIQLNGEVWDENSILVSSVDDVY